MSYLIKILSNNGNMTFERELYLPDVKAEVLRKDDREALSFLRALIMEIEDKDFKNGEFWRILEGHKYLCDNKETDNGVAQVLADYLLKGDYEPNTVKVLRENIKEKDVCVDVGASVGYFTLEMARLSKGKVYSFEPTKNLFRYLEENIKGNGYENVSAYNKALYSKEGVINVNGNATGRDNVEAITLDSLNIPSIDFMKIDIDGSEPEALKGMIQTIERSPNLKMVIEYYPKYMEKLGNKPEDMMDILDKYFTYTKIEGDYNDEYWNYYCIRKNENSLS